MRRVVLVLTMVALMAAMMALGAQFAVADISSSDHSCSANSPTLPQGCKAYPLP